jgi:hypothetical protein
VVKNSVDVAQLETGMGAMARTEIMMFAEELCAIQD